MDHQALAAAAAAAEELTLHSGPAAGLSIKQWFEGVQDEGQRAASVRGRCPSAGVARAYLKLQKAHEEFAVLLKQASPAASASAKVAPNSKRCSASIPLATSMAIVPYEKSPPLSEPQDCALAPLPQHHMPEPVGQACQWRPSRPSWASFRRWWGWLLCTVITLCIPKIATQLIGLAMRFVVKFIMSAVGSAATQAVEELGGAGGMLVSALEEALDLPSSATPDLSAQAAAAAELATSTLKAAVGEANASALAPLVHTVVSQSLQQQQLSPQYLGSQRWQLPGWVILGIGSYIGMVFRGH